MTAPQLIPGLSAIADRYDLILSDIWGVIHNGLESFPAASAALTRFGAERGPVILISNAARPSQDVVSQLEALQVPRTAWQAFVTSGDATRILLAEHAPGPAWAIGSDRHRSLYEGLPLAFAGPEDAAFISCAAPYDEENDTPEDYRARFQIAVARGLPMICANPDIVVQRGTRLIHCAGALAQLYAELGGKVLMAGKPHAPIYELCLLEGQALLGKPIDRRRVLCIGDGLPTDIKGANAQGLDVLFVANGIHAAETTGPDGLDGEAVTRLLVQAGASAAYVMADLAW